MTTRLPAALLALLALGGCARGPTGPEPTTSAGLPTTMTVAVADFPSAYLAERVGGEAVEITPVTATDIAASNADLVAYIPGIQPDVDAAVATLPPDSVVDLTAAINRMADPRDSSKRDPYVWFDPVNVGAMAGTLSDALNERGQVPFPASQYFGLRALRVEADAQAVDQRLQERLNPCRVGTLVVEAPVLGYLARAYAFTQVPLIAWRPKADPVRALYFTVDAEPAVRAAASAEGVAAVPVDTFTRSAPDDDLLQGVVDLADEIAARQDCPFVVPRSTDRPG